MKLIDSITVRHQQGERVVTLYEGDLSQLPEREAVDLLVVSAFPGDYAPTPHSLIGALARRGVSVAALAKDKEVDLRRFSSCWLSRVVINPSVHFRRVLCFEPLYRGKAPEVVGDIFRSIIPLTTGQPPISDVAMPLVASGDQGEPAEAMLEALVDAAVHWLSNGLALDHIKIVVPESARAGPLQQAFARVKQRHSQKLEAQTRSAVFDAFISYAHENKDLVDALVKYLRAARPSLRVFVDRLELQPGHAWQQRVFDALEVTRKVICVFSPDYLASKVCIEEFNIAWIRHRESSNGVLLPVYMYTAELPPHMKLIQYEDVREGDREKLARSASALLSQI